MVFWFTGLPCSGKSTLGVCLHKELWKLGVPSCILDGDDVRRGLNKDLGFSKEDREENVRRIGEVAKLFRRSGLCVIASFISPYRSDRDKVRKLIEENFIELFVNCPLEECARRDVKGMYHKAKMGEIKSFTGVSAPYEEPDNPEIVINTDEFSVEESVQKIMNYLAGIKPKIINRPQYHDGT